MYRRTCLPALAILCLTSFELRAATHVWSGAVSGLWSNDANWSAGAAPQNGETDVVLVFPAGGMNKTMTNDVSVQNIDLLDFQD